MLFTLTIGIASVTTIFSFVNSALYRLPPYPEAARMVAVGEERSGANASFSELSAESVRALRSVGSFERFGLYRDHSVTMSGPTHTTQLRATGIDTALLSMLSVRPLRGRLPDVGEISRFDPVVLISNSLWKERFGGSDRILGQTVTLDGVPHSIVGVAPPGFGFPERAQLWLPLPPTDVGDTAHNVILSGLAMLGRKMSVEQARLEVGFVGKRLAASGPTHLRDVSLVIRDGMIDRGYSRVIAPLALTFLGAAICVLLVACTNVGNLMLVRTAERRTEMAVRASLGATRWRLLRQSLTESTLLGLTAGVLGLLLCLWSIPVITSYVPLEGMPSWVHLGIDARVLGFTLGISLVTVITFGLSPAITGSRLDTMSVLKSGGLSFSGGSRVTRPARRGVVIELALSVVLLVSAVLLWQTYRNLQAIAPGYDADRVLQTTIVYEEARYPDIGRRMQLLADIRARLSAHPRVEGIATRGIFARMLTTTTGPAPALPSSSSERPDHGMYLPGDPDIAINTRPAPPIWSAVVSDDYFQVLGIPLTRGRDFRPSDAQGSEPVAIVSERLARMLWRGEDVLGKQFRIGKKGTSFTVVAVARDVRFTTSDPQGMDAGPKLSVYYSARQVDGGQPELLVRTWGDAESVAPVILAAVRASDPTVATVGPPELLSKSARDAMLGTRIVGSFMGTFALVALVLATIGIYGVLAYSVTDRTREIGIRMALGGKAHDVIGLVVKDGMQFVVIGLAVGVALSLIASPLLRRFVWGVSVTDPRLLALVVATFGVIAFTACWIPARRATQVQPSEALRHE
jgi:putative ABC transport system permease protein